MNADSKQLAKYFEEMETNELIRIIHIDTDEYSAEAKEIVISALKQRGIDAFAETTIEDAKKIRLKLVEEKKFKEKKEATESLSSGLKWLYTLCPGMALWARMFTPPEWEQRRKDIQKCWIRGLILWAVLILGGAIFMGLLFRFIFVTSPGSPGGRY